MLSDWFRSGLSGLATAISPLFQVVDSFQASGAFLLYGVRLSGSGLRAPEEPRGAGVPFTSGAPGRPSHTDPA